MRYGWRHARNAVTLTVTVTVTFPFAVTLLSRRAGGIGQVGLVLALLPIVRCKPFFGLIEQSALDQFPDVVPGLVDRDAQFDRDDFDRRENAAVLRGYAEQVEPSSEQLVREGQQLWILQRLLIRPPPMSAHSSPPLIATTK